jgi:hypothetical protein
LPALAFVSDNRGKAMREYWPTGSSAMNSTEKPEVSFANLSLEPMHGGPLDIVASAPAKFHPNTRSKSDRRVQADLRTEIRNEADRRTGLDRRPKASWEPGSNL